MKVRDLVAYVKSQRHTFIAKGVAWAIERLPLCHCGPLVPFDTIQVNGRPLSLCRGCRKRVVRASNDR